MNFLKKTVGFMAVFCAIPAAIALTARPSVVGTASSRLPTMTAYINAVSGATSSSSTSNLLDNVECIDAYTSCLKGADVCGMHEQGFIPRKNANVFKYFGTMHGVWC